VTHADELTEADRAAGVIGDEIVDLPAELIAELDRLRWVIEMFFACSSSFLAAGTCGPAITTAWRPSDAIRSRRDRTTRARATWSLRDRDATHVSMIREGFMPPPGPGHHEAAVASRSAARQALS